EIAEITYGEDDGGEFSLIRVISQQGDGGAGGANTETGAHDEDHVGFIKVYGDEVTEEDITVQAAGVFDGIDKLERAEEVYADNNLGMTQEVFSNTDDTLYEGSVFKQTDRVHIGMGVQEVNTGGGNDFIRSYSDAGEPDPAQTDGDDGRVNPAIAAGAADDILAGGQGRDTFMFNFLLNAKEEILEKHTRSNGTINWKGVAGENDNVHDHWVEGIGTDTILDFSKQDGDKIYLRGHTVEIAGITQEEDEGGQYSLIEVRSQQGDNGGAHDEDPLGFIKVYGDVVTIEDIKVKAAGVFDGINLLDDIAEAELEAPANLEQPDLEQLQFGAENPEEISLEFTGTQFGDVIRAGSGQQLVEGGAGRDYLISYGDAGEPDPAQTDGANGRINPALPDDVGNDVFVGGSGADTFEFRALLNARREVIEHHTNSSGTINWRGVAGENDNVHDHWVEGIGLDTIMDYSKEEGDKIVVRGHTVQIAEISYDEDEGGEFSLIEIYSQQGDGGAGGANTATGAHDEDPLGFIKVYGDRVEIEDIKVKAANVFDGVDRLDMVDELGDYNGGVQEFSSTTSEEIITSPASIETVDRVFIGSGAQFVDTGVGRDKIMVYADGGEPEPAQLGGDDREVPAELSDDVIRGGQDADQFQFNFLLNATDVMMARHTREDGSINWRSVAGENDAVHDHWVENGGDDTILDYSNQDGDKIILRGHTVEIADVTQGEDEGGDYSLIHVRSQQGDGGGAHDEDGLGTIKVYGDEVTADDIKVVKKNVFDGIDIFEPIPEDEVPNLIYGSNSADSLSGTEGSDNIHGGGGKDTILGNDGDDFIFAGSSNDLVMAGEGNDWIEGGRGNDYLDGGLGDDFVVADSGNDMMVGGAGGDHFVIENGSAGATILDWQDGQDLFDFSRMDTVESLVDLDIFQMGPQMASLSFINENEV
ncbi:calcium-binding protein, partial [Neptuniibacter sp.]|uniref:calcium-binding protein n=1 Tax=Neptuniibacter sp. TaxID=1962643 RepID=UPI00338865E5|nr:calcium-binding protein [Neptuniibacter sp.]